MNHVALPTEGRAAVFRAVGVLLTVEQYPLPELVGTEVLEHLGRTSGDTATSWNIWGHFWGGHCNIQHLGNIWETSGDTDGEEHLAGKSAGEGNLLGTLNPIV